MQIQFLSHDLFPFTSTVEGSRLLASFSKYAPNAASGVTNIFHACAFRPAVDYSEYNSVLFSLIKHGPSRGFACNQRGYFSNEPTTYWSSSLVFAYLWSTLRSVVSQYWQFEEYKKSRMAIVVACIDIAQSVSDDESEGGSRCCFIPHDHKDVAGSVSNFNLSYCSWKLNARQVVWTDR